MDKVKKILLVDDNKPTNFLNKRVLKKTGKVENVYEVENGIEALEFLKKEGKYFEKGGTPDIIFLDINMPKMNGFEFLNVYKTIFSEKERKSLIVFLTTSSWVNDKEAANTYDFVFDFLEKPLDHDKFNGVFQEFQRRRKAS